MITDVHRRWLVACVAFGLIAAGGPALYAAEPEVLFEDDFSELDSSFASTEQCKSIVENNNLVMTNTATWYSRNFYQSTLFEDVDLTVQVRLGEPDAEKGAYAGIGFWALDYNHYYAFLISDSGTVAVNCAGERFYSPVWWRASSALKTGADDWNELRVVTVGNRATVYLNGKKIASFKGKPPAGGGVLGPIFGAGSDSGSARFAGLKVVTPSGPDAVASEETSDPNLIYSDDFAQLDPGRGPESGQMSASNNMLVMKPKLSNSYYSLYGGTLVEDVDASVKVKISDNDPDTVSSASLMFWCRGDDDCYQFNVYDDATVSVSHWIKGRWLNPMPYKAPPAEAKLDVNAVNELRVVTIGKKATLYLNGVVVGSVSSGTPIKEPWQFGLAAESGKAQATAEFQSLVVRKPQAAGSPSVPTAKR